MADMNSKYEYEKEKDLKNSAPDGSEAEIPGENADKTTPGSPIPESVAEDKIESDEAAPQEPKEKESERDKDKSKRKLEGEIKRLGGEFEKLNAIIDSEKERYIRLYAEYDNYRKRTAAEKQSVYAEAYADVLKEILPVYDSLALALTAADDTPDAANLARGVKLTLDAFSGAMAKLGIEEFGDPGDKFDPTLHNAVMHEENEALGEGEIVAVFQRGFKRGDRVLRFAMVKVAN